MSYWLMKSEPDVFSLEDLRQKNVAGWDGVRNYQARKNLRAMRTGDHAFFFYSSTKVPSIVGVMEIVREAYPDTSTPEDGWVQVDVRYLKSFATPLSLNEIRRTPSLQEMVLVKNSRLSVQPVTPAEWDVILNMLEP
jgi:predicted RNA-binding protein with PUA-like domain